MYGKIAKKMATSLIKNEIIESEDRAVYEYSIEVVLSDFMYFSIAILTAIITKSVVETILFYIGFFSIRKYAGGYHAHSYWMCHLLFLANQLEMIFLQSILPEPSLPYIIAAITLISVCCIFLLAPVANENREFTEYEQRKFTVLSRLISVFTALGICVLIIVNTHTKFVFVYAFGIFSVSISLIAEKIKINKRKDLLQ